MNFIKVLIAVITISVTTTSCVSNYVVSNNDYKYSKTSSLLAKHSKGPNVSHLDKSNLASENVSILESDLSNINNYAEKEFTKEGKELIGFAKTYLGTPYRYGGTSRFGIDCSAFVQQVFEGSDINLPRTSNEQSNEGMSVAKEELKKGDLIFFSHSPKSRISHVGIVESVSQTGEVFFIHASTSQGVTVSSLNESYWAKRFRKGRRVLNLPADELQTLQTAENSLSHLSK